MYRKLTENVVGSMTRVSVRRGAIDYSGHYISRELLGKISYTVLISRQISRQVQMRKSQQSHVFKGCRDFFIVCDKPSKHAVKS